MRFQVPLPAAGAEQPIALVVNRSLRPKEEFLMRLRLVDEISEKEVLLSRGFTVPREAIPMDAPPVPEEVMIAVGEELERQRVSGFSSLVLIPPTDEVIFGLWRAEALVTGDRIEKVTFSLDGSPQMSRRRPPFTAELRLDTYPREQIVKAEGFDEHGELVAQDEVILNQPRGELRVRILEPERGRSVEVGDVSVLAEVVVPEEARVVGVEFRINEELLMTLEKPPWSTVVQMPNTRELTYLTVTAELGDGSRAEAVRFFNAPNHMEEVDVNLVELFTSVTDRGGRQVGGLTAADFEVWEDGKAQKIAKFELVDNLPLNLGIAIDVSGSMYESLGEAQRAAIEFLEKIVTPRDRCFAVAFSDRPALLMPRTSDVGAVAERLRDLSANGSTSLHDAIVTSLYYYRGIRGRRALVVLSDGEDTSSSLGFAETLEYARRSGVSIFAIGLRIGTSDFGIRRKLDRLAQETGGRAFYIDGASDLFEVYDKIESELRSQYLVAYNSNQESEKGKYHEIKMKVRGGKLKARTVRGYYS
jgi:VWFA-related protein